MTGFMRGILWKMAATWGFILMPSPLPASPLAAQDDFGMPSHPDEALYTSSDPDKPPVRDERDMARQRVPEAGKQRHSRTERERRVESNDKRPFPVASYRDNLAVSDLRRLASFDKWFTNAAWAVIKKVRQRKQTLLSYAFYDVNGDGAYEAVVLAKTDRRGSQRQSLAIYDFNADMNPVLRFEHHQNIAATVSDYTRIVQNPDHAAGVRFCEDWRIASWQFHECHDLFFDELWQPRVRAYEITTREPQAHATQYARFDFENMRATRSYAHLPEGSFLPARSQSAQYEMLFAPCDETKTQPVQTLRTAQFGQKNDPLHYGITWNDDALNIAIDCIDDDFADKNENIQNITRQNVNSVGYYVDINSIRAFPAMQMTHASDVPAIHTLPFCNDTLSLQTTDHVEVWIDVAPGLQIDRNAPKTWQSDYEKSYHQSPYRHEIDAGLYAMAVTAQGCIVPIHPMRDYWRAMPLAQRKLTPLGYRVDIQIPAAFFGAEGMQKIAGPQGLGLTLRQHDIRENGDFEASETSQYRWADPFSFGQIWLADPNTDKIPIFPFEWNKFLSR